MPWMNAWKKYELISIYEKKYSSNFEKQASPT